MTPSWLQPLLDWLSVHPTWAGVIIFFVALCESLLVVGVLVPGALIMLGAGALIALGALELWSTLIWAIAGAIVGDGISFWIGYFFKERLRHVWPFRRHPQMLARGERFFVKHGGKSVVLGRFVGPVRAVIPTIAGIMGMSPRRFTIVNVLSAIAWAPAYILPGVAVGASLGLASQVATRLGVLLFALIAIVWLVIWSVRSMFRFFQPRANAIVTRTLAWSRNHPKLGMVATALLDARRPEAAALSGLALLLVVAAWLLFATLVHATSGTTLIGIDESVFHLFQDLRTPWADHMFVGISQLGDAQVTVPLTLGISAWLMWQRNWFAAWHWLAAVGFAALITITLKQVLQVPRPVDLYEGAVIFAFPSGHSSISMVMYGFLAVMAAHGIPRAHRWLPYTTAGIVISAIALSRLYLGAHWLSDVVGGLALGLLWVTLLGIAYRRHYRLDISAAKLSVLVIFVLTLTGGWHIAQHHEREVERYAPRYEAKVISEENWWHGDWQSLAAYQIDFKGQRTQPLTLQWAGSQEDIEALLEAQGWKRPPPLDIASVLLWLTPQPSLHELPILPNVHNGRHESILRVRRMSEQNGPMVLRLWPADVTLTGNDQRLWIGTVAYLQLKQLPIFSYATARDDFDAPLLSFQTYLGGLKWKRVHRLEVAHADHPDQIRWQVDALLIQTITR